MTTNRDKPSFEDAFTELQETVAALEAGNLTLDAASRLFEHGMQLAKTCNELLSATEIQVSRLQRSFGEQMAMVQDANKEFDVANGDDPEDGES